MAEIKTDRIRPGAWVECTDGHLGSVDGLEAEAGRPRLLRVVRGWTNQTILVPLDLVREVQDDGKVLLACAKEDIQQLGDPHAVAEAPRPVEERPQAAEPPLEDDRPPADDDQPALDEAPFERTLELREEELLVQKELQEVGEVRVRTEVEEVPGRLEVEAYREEIEVEHVPVGQVVTERLEPWEENGVLIVPVYEEQLVVSKRLVLREHLRVRRIGTVETRLFEDTLRRERAVVEDPANTGLIRERYPADEGAPLADDRSGEREVRRHGGGFLGLGGHS